MRRINLVQKIGRISFILLFVSLLSLIGGAFIMQVTSSSIQLTPKPTTQNEGDFLPNNYLVKGSDSIEQVCCGHEDSTEPQIILVSPGNTSILLAGYGIEFVVTDDNPMEDFLPEEVLFNWDGASNTTLESPLNVSMPSTDGPHILNMYSVDALENWAYKKYLFTTTSDPNAVQILEGDATTTTAVARRSDGFLLLTAIPVFVFSVIVFARRKQ